MTNSMIILVGFILLGGLLFFEKKENLKGLLPTKTALSVLFVLCAAVQPHPEHTYFLWIFTGLVFCLVGDVLLALPQENAFLFGLIAFLVGHLCYVAAFVHLTESNRLTLIGAAATIAVSAGIYRWLRPHLGSMHFPVVFYIIVISAMLCGAWSVAGMERLAVGGRALVFAGALIFYLSDLFVARDRFLRNTFVNRLVGLPLYYGGQFMIAFSVGFILPQQFR
jgi:uncharacterized membrane protein YhhN